jgi:hypothetical protein
MHVRALAPVLCLIGGPLLVLFGSSSASAQSSPLVADPGRAEATVLRVDGDDLIVDVPEANVGDVYRIYRPLTVRHPITGRSLRDRFPIGRVRLTTAGSVLSSVRADGNLERDPEVGDILVPDRAPAATAPVDAPQSVEPTALPPIVDTGPSRRGPPSPSLPGTNPSERELLQVWAQTLGRPLGARIQLYRDYLRARPDSPFAGSVQREILALGSMGGGSVAAPAFAPRMAPRRPDLRGRPADRLRSGDPAVVAFQLPIDSGYSSGLLHVRHQGQSTYRQVLLLVERDGFVRARLAERFVRPPGFAYFVELVDDNGRAIPAVGTATDPIVVQVEAPARPAASAEGRSRVDLRSELADVGTGTFRGVYRPEWFLLVEGDLLQRVRWASLYGYRVGFGLYSGQGQPLSAYEEEDAPPARSGTVVYGYHELELELTSFVHAMVRVEVGMHEQGLVGGGQGRLRIGDERRTNIVVGGDIMDEVGQKAFFAFTFFPTERMPVLTEGEVFNQEIDGGDPMFRLVSQVGYRFEPWLAMALRGSYQLRNIHHGGFGGGVAVTLDW